MDLNATHPLYDPKVADWQLILDSYEGERRVKECRGTYLPATSGMVADGLRAGQLGAEMYDAYLLRAVYPELIKASVDAMIGIMHRLPPVIKLPKGMKPLQRKATKEGESLEVLLRRINEAQLLYGRIGVLVDVMTGAGPASLPHFVTYEATSIKNWQTEQGPDGHYRLAMAVLKEDANEITDSLTWKTVDRRRLLISGSVARMAGVGAGVYMTGVSDGQSFVVDPSNLTIPSIGGVTMSQIPFVIIGSKDLVADPDVPPLLGVANLSMTIYRGEADYRQSLFMQGQETLVISGGSFQDDDERRVGAGAIIELPVGGDAKYIGVQSSGLSEQRQSLENDYKRAAESGAQLLEARGKAAESGDALRVRVAARTATLANVAQTGAEGLQNVLRLAAEWRGFDPNEVSVKPNMSFTEEAFKAQDITYFIEAILAGAPLSRRSLHGWMNKNNMTDMSFEEEIQTMKTEEPLVKGLLKDKREDAKNKQAVSTGSTKRGGGE